MSRYTSCRATVEALRDFVPQTAMKQLAPWSYMHSKTAIQSTEFWKAMNVQKDESQSQVLQRARDTLFNQPATTQCHVKTIDGKTTLDGMLSRGIGKKVVLFVPGMGGHYEEAAIDGTFKKFVDIFRKLDPTCSVMAVNPRGVFLSKGAATPRTWSHDIYSAYKHLIDEERVDPENVLVWGHSMGVPHALNAAAQIQKEYPEKKISAVADRTFLDFADMVKARLGNGKVGTIAKYAIKCFGLNMNGQKAVSMLKGKVLALHAAGDKTVPQARSFALHADRKTIANFQTLELKDMGTDSEHTRELQNEELEAIGNILTDRSLA